MISFGKSKRMWSRNQAATSWAEKWSQHWSVENCSFSKGHLRLFSKRYHLPQGPILKQPAEQQKWTCLQPGNEKHFWSLKFYICISDGCFKLKKLLTFCLMSQSHWKWCWSSPASHSCPNMVTSAFKNSRLWRQWYQTWSFKRVKFVDSKVAPSTV